MNPADIVERLRKILRQELAECEQAIRARDPVRALNDLADASKALKSLIRGLETEAPKDERDPADQRDVGKTGAE